VTGQRLIQNVEERRPWVENGGLMYAEGIFVATVRK